jgi:hypothetical protein
VERSTVKTRFEHISLAGRLVVWVPALVLAPVPLLLLVVVRSGTLLRLSGTADGSLWERRSPLESAKPGAGCGSQLSAHPTPVNETEVKALVTDRRIDPVVRGEFSNPAV